MSLTDLVEHASAIEAMVGIAPAEPANPEPIEADEPEWIRTVFLSTDSGNATAELFIDLGRFLAIKVPPDASDAAKLERNRLVMVLKTFADFVGRSWLEPGRLVVQLYLRRWALAVEQLNDGTTPGLRHATSDRGRRMTRPKNGKAGWKSALLSIAMRTTAAAGSVPRLPE